MNFRHTFVGPGRAMLLEEAQPRPRVEEMPPRPARVRLQGLSAFYEARERREKAEEEEHTRQRNRLLGIGKPPDYTRPVPFADLHSSQCHYKLASGYYCGARTARGSWCQQHYDKTHVRRGGVSAASERMRALNERMKSDPSLKATWLASILRARGGVGYRQQRSEAMREKMAEPEMKAKAAEHCRAINRDPSIRSRQWAGRRGAIPRGMEELYRELRRKVGAEEAMRLVWEQRLGDLKRRRTRMVTAQ